MKINAFSSAVAAVVLTSSALRAQAPVITTAGDPSVAADTIYKLSPYPADAPDDALVYLFNDGVIRLGPDGRGTRTYRQVVAVLKQTAVAQLAERRLTYAPDHEKLTLNWARVVRPTGEVVSEKPAQMQEGDVAAPVTNPVYVNAKELRLSFGGVAAGTIIDISYTIEETQPYHLGDAYAVWNVNLGSVRVLRSRFVYDVPTAVKPVFTERNLDFRIASADGGGRTTYQWARANVAKYRGEPFAPDTNSLQMYVVASLPGSWNDVAKWYSDLAADRYALSGPIDTKLHEVVAGAHTRLDTIRAVHRWVTADIRYVSISLGLGGYQPRKPAQTFTDGLGDCKDKATMFIAALRALGIPADPVLLNIDARIVRKEHPSIKQFNHAIAAVPDGSGFIFTDLTAEFTPYGELPVPEQGGFAVVVLPNGRAQEVVLPKAPFLSRRIETRIVATMTDDGLLSGSMQEINTGGNFEARRNAFSVPLDSARKALIMKGLLLPLPSAQGDSMLGFNGRDLYAAPNYTIYFSKAKGTSHTGGLELFTFPFGVMPGTVRASSLEALGPRVTSIVADDVLRPAPPTSILATMVITLPEGWHVRVPANVVVTSDFGTYSTEYSQQGRVFTIVRKEISAHGIYAPTRIADVIAFYRATAADENNKSIVIDKGGM